MDKWALFFGIVLIISVGVASYELSKSMVKTTETTVDNQREDEASLTMISRTEYVPGDTGQVITELRYLQSNEPVDAVCRASVLYPDKSILFRDELMEERYWFSNDLSVYLFDDFNTCGNFQISGAGGSCSDFWGELLLFDGTPGSGGTVSIANTSIPERTGRVEMQFSDRTLGYGWWGYNNNTLNYNGTELVNVRRDLDKRLFACGNSSEFINLSSNALNLVIEVDVGNQVFNFTALNSSGVNQTLSSSFCNSGNKFDQLRMVYNEQNDSNSLVFDYVNISYYPNESSGTHFYNFTVPSTEGVYEYRAVCEGQQTEREYTTSKSFHVSSAFRRLSEQINNKSISAYVVK